VLKSLVFNQKIQGCQDRLNLLPLKAMVFEVQRMDQRFEQVFTHFKQQVVMYKVDQIFVLMVLTQQDLQNQSNRTLLTQLFLPQVLPHLLLL